jgi:3-phenylpropionate/trans-cinnamate dioxygenase ferredoxin component
MAEWQPIAPANQIATGDFVQAEVGDYFVAVYNIDGEFLAIEDVCTHDGEGLAGGVVENGEVTCPRHGARFSLRTGRALSPPAYEPVRTFRTRVMDGIVEVLSQP